MRNLQAAWFLRCPAKGRALGGDNSPMAQAYLQPYGQELLAGDYSQADETPIKYCDPDNGEKKTGQGSLCGYSQPGGSV